MNPLQWTALILQLIQELAPIIVQIETALPGTTLKVAQAVAKMQTVSTLETK